MRRDSFSALLAVSLLTFAAILFTGMLVCPARLLAAQNKPPDWSGEERLIALQLKGLRKLPDDVRASTTKDLALQIRELRATPNKLRLAVGPASLSTEGDFGHDTLQEGCHNSGGGTARVASSGWQKDGAPAYPYVELASLVRDEHVQATVDAPQFAAAVAKLESDDAKREHAEFTLNDLQGKAWSLKDLRGKVVLLNFWATWCPPCRKEMPDLEALYLRFNDQGLVILAVSDEDAAKVSPFLAERSITYPVLLDPGRKVNEQLQIEGIPKSFVYDRSGKLVAQSIDMRTQRQFLEMLSQAGLQ
jgi:peroxiredoxin